MRLGLVRFVNARPLDYGLRNDASQKGYKLLEATPATLCDLLLQGELDAALISSVEFLRHGDALGACQKVGVCARERVRSILYLYSGAASDVPRRLYADAASRSSTALLRWLLFSEFGARPEVIALSADLVVERCQQEADCAGLLIGDSALDFEANPVEGLQCRDLAEWWRAQSGLPFVFALWAYPRLRPLPDALFEDSLLAGLAALPQIAAATPYRDALSYLSESLHYQLDAEDRRSLAYFSEVLKELDAPIGGLLEEKEA
ncbi:MAG: menaquinone biosynthesis protein [Leptospirales bacterium]|nr:menaquinone biosynthesis protein [Leptospirales bacterium]